MGPCVGKFSTDKDEDWASRTVEYRKKSSGLPRISMCLQSKLVLNMLTDYLQGKTVDLEPIKIKYSEIHRNGTTFIWDLEQMTTDFEDNWTGQSFDGLAEIPSNRDEIGIVILKALIAQGTDPKTLTSHGRTAFQIAALSGDLEFCKELVNMGVDVHQSNEAGETALDLVNQWNNKPEDLSQIISYLAEFN